MIRRGSAACAERAGRTSPSPNEPGHGPSRHRPGSGRPMRASFLRHAKSTSLRKGQVTSRRRPAKLRVERLEDRLAPALIDLFTTDPPQLVSVTGQGTNTSSLGGLADVVGGSREITIVNNGPEVAQNVT